MELATEADDRGLTRVITSFVELAKLWTCLDANGLADGAEACEMCRKL